jgi:VIT1/CCC1 family predicted Fe2+/Mn2+ transporter
MMREELGLIEQKISPIENAFNTFIGFTSIGIIPLVPFLLVYFSGSLLSASNAFFYSVLATASAFFLIGVIRGKVVQKSLIRAGLNTLIIGGAAAAASFAVGNLLSTLVR